MHMRIKEATSNFETFTTDITVSEYSNSNIMFLNELNKIVTKFGNFTHQIISYKHNKFIFLWSFGRCSLKKRSYQNFFSYFLRFFLYKKDNKLKFKIHLFINNEAFRKNFT